MLTGPGGMSDGGYLNEPSEQAATPGATDARLEVTCLLSVFYLGIRFTMSSSRNRISVATPWGVTFLTGPGEVK